MTGKEFVKLCYDEKESILHEYFDINSQSIVAKKLQDLMKSGVSKEDLFDIVNSVLTENYYNLLLGLDGAASLGGEQISYQLYDEKGNLLNECGEIEESAYNYFMEE